MKVLAIIVLGVFAVSSVQGQLQCTHKQPNIPKVWIDMVNPCVLKMREQIMEELKAAIQYWQWEPIFLEILLIDQVLPNSSLKLPVKKRQHAIKLISYLLMRGELTSSVSNLIKRHIVPEVTDWANGVSALQQALQLEAKVTKKIRDVIIVCETPTDGSGFNDYHLVDHLTGEFLEEQYKAQRDIAGKISNLDKMMDRHAALGEYLFDKKLLNGDI